MTKNFLGFASLALLIFLIVWLWQRQPSGPNQTVLSKKTEVDKTLNPNETQVSTKPQDNLVVASQIIKIKGKLNPGDYLLIASDSENNITKIPETGEFAIEVSLTKGLNLLNYISISPDLKKININPLTYYYSPEKKFKTVYAGSVKSIFDTLITLTTPNGEINARTSRSTELDIPILEDSDLEESTATALRNIRVGDYAISLGENSDENTQNSANLTVLRQNKPQNNSKFVTAQIAADPKQNKFPVKSLLDSTAIELTLTKETDIRLESEIPQNPPPNSNTSKKNRFPADQIKKDKNAIIIFHEENGKNVVDLIYILP